MKTKPTLLFLHGLRGTHEGFRFITPPLEKDFHILSIDLPGYGDTPALTNQTLANHISHLHDFVKKLPAKPIIVAHSMGATIASHYCATYPKDTDQKLVFLAPIFRTKSSVRKSRALYYMVSAAFSVASIKLLKSPLIPLATSRYLTTDKSKQDFINQEHRNYAHKISSKKAYLADIKTTLFNETTIPRNKDTLIIVGDHDRLVRASLAKTVAKKAEAKYILLPNTGHLLNYEQPETVAAIIRKFVLQKI